MGSMITQADSTQPNILIILADQLAAQALSCYVADFANTPTIDELAQNGVCFTKAYTTCPLRAPARASCWSGLLPHQTGVMSNGGGWEKNVVDENTISLGSTLTKAGYDCHHFGKEYDFGALHGFKRHEAGWEIFEAPDGLAYNQDSWQDEHTTQQLEAFFQQQEHSEPWCVIADMQNPHNICGFVAENTPNCLDDSEPNLPDLPSNFHTNLSDRPLPVQYVCCSHRRQFQSRNWNDQQWRQYRAAYRHFIERCDKHLQRILDALRKRSDAENTRILFFADHGDSMGAHKLATKHTTFYQDTTRIPFIISGAGVSEKGHHADQLVSLIDIFPTVCDVAGIEKPHHLRGISHLPSTIGQQVDDQHTCVVSQWHTQCYSAKDF